MTGELATFRALIDNKNIKKKIIQFRKYKNKTKPERDFLPPDKSGEADKDGKCESEGTETAVVSFTGGKEGSEGETEGDVEGIELE